MRTTVAQLAFAFVFGALALAASGCGDSEPDAEPVVELDSEPDAEPVVELIVFAPDGSPLKRGSYYASRGPYPRKMERDEDVLLSRGINEGRASIPVSRLGKEPFWLVVSAQWTSTDFVERHLDFLEARITDLNPEPQTIEVKLKPALSVAGRVVGPDGEGVEDAAVWITRADMALGMERMTQAFEQGKKARLRTGADGAFRLDGVQLGSGRAVVAVDPGGNWVRPEWALAQAGDQDVLIPVKRGADLSGRVFDHAGKPLPGVVVGASWSRDDGFRVPDMPRGHLQRTTSGPDGAFTLRGVAADRELTLHVLTLPDPKGAQQGYLPWRRESVRAPAAGIEVRLRKGYYHITGKVVGTDGEPIGAFVKIATFPLWNITAYTRRKGGEQRFRLGPVRQGTYRVRAESSRGSEAGLGVATVRVPGDPVVLTVVFKPPVRLRFSVQGMDRDGFRMGLHRVAEPVPVGPENRVFDFEKQYDDPQTIYVWHPDDDRYALALNALPSESPHTLPLRRGQSISGTVDKIDRPADSHIVVLARHKAHHRMCRRKVRASPTGAFAIRGLPPGTYQVWAWVLQPSGHTYPSTHSKNLKAGATAVVLRWKPTR